MANIVNLDRVAKAYAAGTIVEDVSLGIDDSDRIGVVGGGTVVELGSHDELLALGGRCRTMFDLQAQRFTADADEDGDAYEHLA